MDREEWGSRLGFIAAALGSSIGIGNIWRFPYVLSLNGGGAFLIPYIIAVAFFGIPLLLIELSTGRRFRESMVTAFKKINPKMKMLRWIPTITIFFILSYYIVVVGWTLTYFINASLGQFLEFQDFSSSHLPLLATIVSLTLVLLVCKNSIKDGVEKVSKIILPILFILLLLLIIKTLSFPKSLEGIKNYFTPDYSKIFDLKVWLHAFGQALFSIGVGYGIMITYGSYLNKKEDIPHLTNLIVFSDTLIALIGGLIIFSTIYSFSLPISEGPHLAFVVLVKVFEEIRFGFVLGSIFFALLFLAGITSAISMMETLVSNLVDEYNFKKEKASLLIFFLILPISVLVSLSYTNLMKINLLEIMDFYFGTLLTLLSGAIVAYIIGWYWNPKSLLTEMNIRFELGLKKIGYYIDHFVEYIIVINLVKYVIPFTLLLIFVLKVVGVI
ncbi:MAG: sodium-dependent transporter [Candidatus Aenigmarchaeota archaeon]|nr:sodium-dependent transporter [Candidatus Aenigmarchaeota archaeon]